MYLCRVIISGFVWIARYMFRYCDCMRFLRELILCGCFEGGIFSGMVPEIAALCPGCVVPIPRSYISTPCGPGGGVLFRGLFFSMRPFFSFQMSLLFRFVSALASGWFSSRILRPPLSAVAGSRVLGPIGWVSFPIIGEMLWAHSRCLGGGVLSEMIMIGNREKFERTAPLLLISRMDTESHTHHCPLRNGRRIYSAWKCAADYGAAGHCIRRNLAKGLLSNGNVSFVQKGSGVSRPSKTYSPPP